MSLTPVSLSFPNPSWSLSPTLPYLSLRDIREYANGSVCVDCDAQCELADDDSLTCNGPVSFSIDNNIQADIEALIYVYHLNVDREQALLLQQ